MVPVAMAYAQIAGVPAQVGLYTAFAALLGYGIFGTSRQLKVTTTSTMAVMSAPVVEAMVQGDVGRYMALSSALAFITVGIILLAAGSDMLLAQVRGSVRDRLRHSGIMAEIGEDRVYRSVATAVYDFGRREGLSET